MPLIDDIQRARETGIERVLPKTFKLAGVSYPCAETPTTDGSTLEQGGFRETKAVRLNVRKNAMPEPPTKKFTIFYKEQSWTVDSVDDATASWVLSCTKQGK